MDFARFLTMLRTTQKRRESEGESQTCQPGPRDLWTSQWPAFCHDGDAASGRTEGLGGSRPLSHVVRVVFLSGMMDSNWSSHILPPGPTGDQRHVFARERDAFRGEAGDEGTEGKRDKVSAAVNPRPF